MPFTLAADQWSWLCRAIEQRSRLLNSLVRDIYGPQELLKSGAVPAEIIFPQTRYQRAFLDLDRTELPALTLYATELARGQDGRWYAMADRTDAPLGLGFALENRITTSRLLPRMVHRFGVDRLAPFFVRVRNALARLSVRDSPRVVVLSPGPQSPYYFEDVYLARYLGYTLVEGGDLAVRDDRVFLKTLSGLHPVDVIYSRTTEGALDPLEQGDEGSGGIPGLLQAVRSGSVRLANRPGCGLLEAPVFMAFLRGCANRFLTRNCCFPPFRPGGTAIRIPAV